MWGGSVVRWMQETHWSFSNLIIDEDTRGPLKGPMCECIGMFFDRKWRLEDG
jgi:hypothetical protein